MGIPKFYRWLSERYPKINQVITDLTVLPEFDNFYLDMNGIIHACSHPNGQDISMQIPPDDMKIGVWNYLDRIVSDIIRPKQLLFIAVDGVAPRAKLNQQRSRRFRSAAEHLRQVESLSRVDPEAATREMFDSNSITPGTEFMECVDRWLHEFVQFKRRTDERWNRLTIIVSGSDVPGEGEHKIMNYIRDLRTTTNNPNTRHVMCGQDADLIVLALATHEPHFYLFRELVDFSYRKPGSSSNSQQRVRDKGKQLDERKIVRKQVQNAKFQILSVAILREYLEMEVADKLKHHFELERIINDFVVMTFFVGNDFIPNLPLLDISSEVFDSMFDAYSLTKSSFNYDCYMSQGNGNINIEFLTRFLSNMIPYETRTFRSMKGEVFSMKKCKEFADQKDGYYHAKFNWNWMTNSQENLPTKAYLGQRYVDMLEWNAKYYFCGCVDWGTFYPHHYCIIMSDLVELLKSHAVVVNGTIGDDRALSQLNSPFQPMEQLFSVLPPPSFTLLPAPFKQHRENEFYNVFPWPEFQIDMNGKRNEWEGIVLLPFLSADAVQAAFRSDDFQVELRELEKHRNQFGNDVMYSSQPTVRYFPPLLPPPLHCFGDRLLAGCDVAKSLNLLAIASSSLESIGVNCFGRGSRYRTRVLNLSQEYISNEFAENPSLLSPFINKPVLTLTPFISEARVVSFSNGKVRIMRGADSSTVVETLSEDDARAWKRKTGSLTKELLTGNETPGAGGIRINGIQITASIQLLTGVKHVLQKSGLYSRTRAFGTEIFDVPFQLICLDERKIHLDSRFTRAKDIQMSEIFPVNCPVAIIKGENRGLIGTVRHCDEYGLIDLDIKYRSVLSQAPFAYTISYSISESYMSLDDAADGLAIPTSLLYRVIGSLMIMPSELEIGLNLVSESPELIRWGYARKTPESFGKSSYSRIVSGETKGEEVTENDDYNEDGDDENDDISLKTMRWELSNRGLECVREYLEICDARIVTFLRNAPKTKNATVIQSTLIPKNLKKDSTVVFQNLSYWIKSKSGIASSPMIPTDSQVMAKEAIELLEKAVDSTSFELYRSEETSRISIDPEYLFTFNPNEARKERFNDLDGDPVLGDRIVNVRAPGVPFGCYGTVIAIHKVALEKGAVSSSSGNFIDVLFDREFIGGGTLQGLLDQEYSRRGKLCAWEDVLRFYPLHARAFVRPSPEISRTASTGSQSGSQAPKAKWRPKAVEKHAEPEVLAATPTNESQTELGNDSDRRASASESESELTLRLFSQTLNANSILTGELDIESEESDAEKQVSVKDTVYLTPSGGQFATPLHSSSSSKKGTPASETVFMSMSSGSKNNLMPTQILKRGSKQT